ncbi:MAG: CBS domain-containing protein [Sphingobacteriaceae bacterium]|nr:MAG: CBS domain-containing protein [Sphingobacteriaceae bacterium]
MQKVTYGQESVIYQQEISKMKGVDLIFSGSYESFIYDNLHNMRLAETHTAGFCFGGQSILMNRNRSLRTVIAREGTVVYFLPRKNFKALCQTFETFFQFFTIDFGRRMMNEEFANFFKNPSSFAESNGATDQIYSKKIIDIEQREIISCSYDTPIYEAAAKMARAKVSCLFVKDEHDKINGYVTDITMRDNVVARQVDAAGPISSVMDNPVISISTQAYVYEALLMMFRTKTRYLLTEENGEYVGSLSRNKLLSEQAQSPLVFIQSVKSATSVTELKQKWRRVPLFVIQLLDRGVNAEIVNQVITTIADTIALKVIESAIAELGPPPAKFVFMTLGSEGRKEQSLKTDQDNAIVYEDKANEQRELVRDYFLTFADIVSERLNTIGFVFCSGGFMAKNPKWTHSLSHWKRNYTEWMEESVPETIINFSTFFDCRFIYGEVAIMNDLKSFLDEALKKPMEKVFFHMANNALQYEPPLTFFRNIRTITKDKQEVFDIKKAMTPIVDLVRIYALKNRVFEVNTGERLKALQQKGVFTETEVQELSQSYYFLMSMRLKNQANQIIHDKSDPDNYIHLDKLTTIEEATLKEIFKIIKNFQLGIKVRFTNRLLG